MRSMELITESLRRNYQEELHNKLKTESGIFTEKEKDILFQMMMIDD